jgi:hypothetical protein
MKLATRTGNRAPAEVHLPTFPASPARFMRITGQQTFSIVVKRGIYLSISEIPELNLPNESIAQT